jgi:hypothetical protein
MSTGTSFLFSDSSDLPLPRRGKKIVLPESEANSALRMLLEEGRHRLDVAFRINKIIADPMYQCRVEPIDIGNVKDLQERLVEGVQLDPIVLFRDKATGEHFLADGFHRVEAYTRHKSKSIPAYVIESDNVDLEVRVFCGLANKHRRSQKMTKEDMLRHCDMMLENAELFGWSDTRIAEKCGLSRITVDERRAKHCLKFGISMPVHLLAMRNGKEYIRTSRHTKIKDRQICTTETKSGTFQHTLNINGKANNLGNTPTKPPSAEIIAKADFIRGNATESRAKWPIKNAKYVIRLFTLHIASQQSAIHSQLSCVQTRYAFLAIVSGDAQESLLAAAKTCDLAEQMHGPLSHKILVGYTDSLKSGHSMKFLRSLGYLILTPEEADEWLIAAEAQSEAPAMPI